MTTDHNGWVVAFDPERNLYYAEEFNRYYEQGQHLWTHRISCYKDFNEAYKFVNESNARQYDIFYHDIGGYHIVHRNNSVKHPNPLLISCNHTLEEADALTEKYDNQHTRFFVVSHHDGNGIRWSEGYSEIVAFRFDSFDEDDYGRRKPTGTYYTDVAGPFRTLTEAQDHKETVDTWFNSYNEEN